MRPTICLVLSFAFASARAQFAPTLPNAAAPGRSPMPAAGIGAPTFTNEFGTSFTIAELSTLLGELETNIVTTLPVLAAFNNSFDFVNFGLSGARPGLVPTTTANFGTSLGSNFSLNLAAHAGANVATPTGTGTNGGFASVPITRDTLRQLLVVQADLERALPLLEIVNGQTNLAVSAINQTFAPGTLTNSFAVLSNQFLTPLTNGFGAPLVSPPPLMTPTGR